LNILQYLDVCLPTRDTGSRVLANTLFGNAAERFDSHQEV